jgi:hypothetical protein
MQKRQEGQKGTKNDLLSFLYFLLFLLLPAFLTRTVRWPMKLAGSEAEKAGGTSQDVDSATS